MRAASNPFGTGASSTATGTSSGRHRIGAASTAISGSKGNDQAPALGEVGKGPFPAHGASRDAFEHLAVVGAIGAATTQEFQTDVRTLQTLQFNFTPRRSPVRCGRHVRLQLN